MNRRTALKLGVAGAMSAWAGCAAPVLPDEEDRSTPGGTRDGSTEPPARDGERSTGTTTSPRHAGRFDTVVDAVAEGADPSGGRSLNPVLDAVAADDTMVFLPEGRYLMDDYWRFESFSNFGIVGDDATIVPPDGYAGNLFGVGAPRGATDFLFEGIAFDFRAPSTGGRALHAKVEDGLEVRDVSVRGTLDVKGGFMRVDVTDPSGRGVVERLRAPDGGTPGSHTSGCYVGETNRGDVDFVDCHVVGFPDNGIYAEPPAGTMRVLGGYYANNAIANVRITDGVVRNVHVRCDADPPGFGNMRGIRLVEGSNALVEGCRVEFLEVPFSDGAIVAASGMDSATIRDTRIRIDTDNIAAVLGKPATNTGSGSTPDTRSESGVRCENVCIEGTAANGSAIHVEQRDGSVFDRVFVHQTGSDRNGITLVDLDDGVVMDSCIDTTGDPLVFTGSQVRREDVEFNTSPPYRTPCITSNREVETGTSPTDRGIEAPLELPDARRW